MDNVSFASRVSVISPTNGRLFFAHPELARKMAAEGRISFDPSVLKKIQKGRSVHVTQIYLTSVPPGPEQAALNRNSSKTTFVQRFSITRFNERGEPGRGIIAAGAHMHKRVEGRDRDMYGLRARVEMDEMTLKEIGIAKVLAKANPTLPVSNKVLARCMELERLAGINNKRGMKTNG